MSTDFIYIEFQELEQLVSEVLICNGLSSPQSEAVANVIVQSERDQCRSHGLYRVTGVIKSMMGGIVDLDATPEIDNPIDKAILKVNAKGAFSPLALQMGAPLLAEKAKKFGIAAMAINDCVHFSALWPEVELLASYGVASLAMCPSNAYTAPAGGIRKLLGTNPFAFAWPYGANENPYVFDFATSVVARGEIELYGLENKKIPEGWAIDSNGNPTDNPSAALEGALLTFGLYKGSAISTMIEILSGILINDLLSIESTELDKGKGLSPRHGELIIAINPQAFSAENLVQHSKKLFDEIIDQGARLPSQRRFHARTIAQEKGIMVSKDIIDKLKNMKKGVVGDELF